MEIEIVDYHKKIIFFNSLISELSSSALLVHEKLLISSIFKSFFTKFSEEYIGDAFLELKSLI